MITATLEKKALPERTLGRSGYDLFSSRKDLTVIMIPFERFSPFAKAVDDLYKTIGVPFNLIVVEGNAPEAVRASLQKRQRKHKNMTIIYSDHQTSTGAAINLAVPHLRTPHVFIMDNDVRIPRGAMGEFLRRAVEKPYGIVCPQNYAVLSRRPKPENRESIQPRYGIRTCLLISRDTLDQLGKFDETMTPFTTGIDIRMAAERLGIPVCNETSTRLELDSENFLWPMDASLHSFQWNEDRVLNSLKGLEKKWGILLPKQDCAEWLKRKKKDLEDSKNLLFFLARLIFKTHFSPKQENQGKEMPAFSLPLQRAA